MARQWSAVKGRGGAKTSGRQDKRKLTAHAKAHNANPTGAFWHGQQVIAGGQDVIERAAPLR
ncbi:Uncharacterised protein [Mycobacterium tuberculosis]|uniref:Uncharacterized protein n=1 Tax=Mycobacterium tuberculosis TaxID=1773 RepID=A0A0U0T3W2_MYCTX|nr:Uncharacterised protein [Mycobacterium tuberculosis]COX45871.1 Uncharacterised protein [Mycobacterium tuberculosis]